LQHLCHDALHRAGSSATVRLVKLRLDVEPKIQFSSSDEVNVDFKVRLKPSFAPERL